MHPLHDGHHLRLPSLQPGAVVALQVTPVCSSIQSSGKYNTIQQTWEVAVEVAVVRVVPSFEFEPVDVEGGEDVDLGRLEQRGDGGVMTGL